MQLTYNGLEDILELDNTDIRFADRIRFGKDEAQEITYGITLNDRLFDGQQCTKSHFDQ
ncbi:MAG: hypothetical protein ACRERU_02945 [Methylococcales bacterium]